ncbi:hypothetical protein KP509_11G018200 [Ceratopteris richardii]|uniref:Fucosyltransferase n=1 Tax=Ceratopteris richardii TaxID=49495 RepID=A0A8T2TMS3_CERRI|nr:hypothetical protein KP509_11G018200 [Ceratopteris richardii]
MRTRSCRRSIARRCRPSSRIRIMFFVFLFLILLLMTLGNQISEQLFELLHFVFYGRYAVVTSIPNSDAVSFNRSFTRLSDAYAQWDAHVGCSRFIVQNRTHSFPGSANRNPSLQDPEGLSCASMRLQHVSVFVKEWRWLPDSLENLYSCRCGLSCLWSKSEALTYGADAELYETGHPPRQRKQGEPLRVYMDLEPGRRSPAHKDIFISYHADDTVQATYAGTTFHLHRGHYISPIKQNDVLIYWSSSHCVPSRTMLARELLAHLPHHSYGKCLNNVGGRDMILRKFPHCASGGGNHQYWAYHLHCAMSHYKFVLAIENTFTESYVTEKLFYALDAGAIPIYFGAGNVHDLVPTHSIIDGSKFSSMKRLADYIKEVATNPILYAEYHAWRRCGVMGPYHQTRAVSLDSLPCRLCGVISKLGGKAYPSS